MKDEFILQLRQKRGSSVEDLAFLHGGNELVYWNGSHAYDFDCSSRAKFDRYLSNGFVIRSLHNRKVPYFGNSIPNSVSDSVNFRF